MASMGAGGYAQIASAAMDTVFSVIGGHKAGKAAKKAATQVEQGFDKSGALERELFGQTEQSLQPFVSGGTKAFDTLQDFLGLNGQEGRDRALESFQTSPGFQFALEQGQGLIENSNATKGLLTSGKTLKDLTKFGQGMANQEFNSFLDRLTNASGVGQSSAVQTGTFREGSGVRQQDSIQGSAGARASGILGKNAAFQQMLANVSAAGEKVAGAFGGSGGTEGTGLSSNPIDPFG